MYLLDALASCPPFAIQPNRESLARHDTASDKGLAAKAKVVKPTSVGLDDLVPLSELR
jgi:hypothetical protein